ncbi:hypothetical protein V6N13_106584 [Hibiscus sabdariffa]
MKSSMLSSSSPETVQHGQANFEHVGSAQAVSDHLAISVVEPQVVEDSVHYVNSDDSFIKEEDVNVEEGDVVTSTARFSSIQNEVSNVVPMSSAHS